MNILRVEYVEFAEKNGLKKIDDVDFDFAVERQYDLSVLLEWEHARNFKKTKPTRIETELSFITGEE